MNEVADQSIPFQNRGQGWQGRSGNRNEKRDSKTGRFSPMEPPRTLEQIKRYHQAYHRANKQKHSEYAKLYYLQHKEQIKQKTASWSRNNLPRVRVSKQKYKVKRGRFLDSQRYRLLRSTEDGRLQLRNYWKQQMARPGYKARHNLANRKYRATAHGRAKMKALTSRWLLTPNGMASVRSRDRRRYLLKRAVSLPDATLAIRKIIEVARRCFYCGIGLTRKNLHIDHLKPIARGGAHAAFNLVPSCKPCNLRKSDREPNQFVSGQQLLVFQEPHSFWKT